MGTRYSASISGFGQWASTGDPETPVADDAIKTDKFLYVYVGASVPSDIDKLQGRFRKTTPDSSGGPEPDYPMTGGEKVTSGDFRLLIDHYALDGNSEYLLRVADDFADPKCLAGCLVKTV